MVVVGSSLMVGLNGLTAGQLESTERQLNQLADNVLTVTPGQNSFRSIQTTPSIVFNSVVVSRINSLAYIDEVVPRYTGNVDLNSQARVLCASVLSMNPEAIYVNVPGVEMEPGSVIKSNDPSAILVGATVATPDGATFPIVTLGQSVKLTFTSVGDDGEQDQDSRVFVVSGILKESGDFSLDRSVVINESVGNTFLKKSGKFDSLLVVAQSSELVDAVEEEIRELYGTTIGITSLKQQLEFRQGFIGGFNSFILSIGVIAMFVGAVGIITTLYTSVTERTKEIGTMKAIGTQNSSILSLFVIEALLIGILGGTFGIAIGIGAGYSLTFLLFSNLPTGGSGITPIFVIEDLIFVWLLSVGLSVLAGILPAWKASRLSPLVALRRE
jgi:putative ABC transport system permease protein